MSSTSRFQQKTWIALTRWSIVVDPAFIRMKINTLDKSKKYVVCCDTGRRSSAGAYILSERGYQAFVLRGGINKDQA